MVQQNIEVPAFINNTTPSFPNYRLGTAPVCDSTKVFPPGLLTALDQIDTPDNSPAAHIALYPNPSDGIVYIELFSLLGHDAHFHLYNLQGQRLFAQSLSGQIGTERIQLPDLPSGMYLYSVLQDGVLIKTDKVVID